MKKKINIVDATLEEIETPGMKFIWQHGVTRDLPMKQLVVNDWNYNEMSEEEFNLLAENVNDVYFLDPLLVVPIKSKTKDSLQMFRITDGEHRFEQQRIDDAKIINCVIADPEIFTEKEQMRQTARMNRIRGHTNKEKFTKFVDTMISKHSMPVDEVAYEMGFVDQSEFDSLKKTARDSLPSQEAKEEFDNIKDEIKTVDDLSNIINRLITKYSSTLTHNFMFLDYGGKESIWIRFKKEDFKLFAKLARDSMQEDAALDSVIMNVFKRLNTKKFIDKYRDEIERGKKEKMFDIDGLIEDVD